MTHDEITSLISAVCRYLQIRVTIAAQIFPLAMIFLAGWSLEQAAFIMFAGFAVAWGLHFAAKFSDWLNARQFKADVMRHLRMRNRIDRR